MGRIFLYGGLLTLAGACVPVFQVSNSSSASSPARPAGLPQPEALPTSPSPKDQIVFISLAISQDAGSGRRLIRVEDLVRKPGVLKSRAPAPLPAGPYLTCTWLAGSRQLDSLHLEHPLFKNQEYVNEQNQFARKAISLDQAVFFIRFAQKGADYLKIEEVLPGNQAQELIRIKL